MKEARQTPRSKVDTLLALLALFLCRSLSLVKLFSSQWLVG